MSTKPKQNPKINDSSRIRKVSLPNQKVVPRIPLSELRQNFRRQISLPKEKDVLPLYDPMAKVQGYSSIIRGKTGIIFDEKMNEHYNLWDENYPENPERLNCILRRCRELELFSDCQVIDSISATKKQILTMHEETLYSALQESQNFDFDRLKEYSGTHQDIYINQNTFEASLLSAGCCLEITKRVLEGEIQNGMALVRPPGHHATVNEHCGFCLFNNVALATHYALTKVNRILIVDWDVHHGQGTQRMFYNDPRVLFFSTHRYENGKFWPHLRESDYDYCGIEEGEGFNFNVPLNQTGMGNAEFLAYFHQVLLPVAYEFNPEVVFVSCGYDAAVGCPEGEMKLTPAMYAHLTSMLMSLAGGKVVVFLEGGYCLESLAESATHTLRTLMGQPCSRLVDDIGTSCSSMCETLLNVISTHRSKWKSLSFQSSYEEDDNESQDFPKHSPQIIFEGKDDPGPGTIYPIVPYVYERTEQEIELLIQELARIKKETSLELAANRVCLVYDSDMEKHCNVADKSFPEKPARTKEIMKKFKEYGLLDRITQLESRRALRSELNLFHEDKFIDFIISLGQMSPRDRLRLEDDFESIYFHKDTWDSARLATGSLLQVVDGVCSGEHQSGLGVIRPPGHHAERGTPYGFCFFNNVCLAAIYAMKKYSLKRILIVDWDIHHGNGIQHCFESDPDVLYISIHLYKNGNFFPYSKEANADNVGSGPGRGFNINIPWSKSGMGDGDYMSAFTQVVLPVAYQFNPDLVLVSAGFDAAVNDPLGGCCVTPECFGHLTHMLSSLANNKIILALEGGYNITSISHCMVMCAKALLGDPLPSLKSGLHPSKSAVMDICKVISVQKRFWSSLKFQVSLPEKILNSESKKQTPQKIIASVVVHSTSSSQKNDSDLEYFTPPTSPANTSTASAKKSISPQKPASVAEDDLIESFSSLSVSYLSAAASSVHTNDGLPVEELEGAVGMDVASQITIAQILQGDSEMHAVIPLPWCPHLSDINPVPFSGFSVLGSKCEECADEKENWQCLTCYSVLCGRYVREHMVTHGIKEEHYIVLSHSDLSVWCYACKSYVHNEILYPVIQAATISKFPEIS